ncbi:hypothetical protein F5X97DRAFT_315290 [Nemania serpens]|nr:hypothetical protein F5X97DRAFT_315290 [Nemania serpens]
MDELPGGCFHSKLPANGVQSWDFVKCFGKAGRVGKPGRGDTPVPRWRKDSGELVPITNHCVICAGYGFRGGLQVEKQEGFIPDAPPIENIDRGLVNWKSYAAGYLAAWAVQQTNHSSLNQPSGLKEYPSGPSKRYRFEMKPGQYGEVYHTLIAAILMPPNYVASLTSQAPEAAQVFDYFHIRQKFKAVDITDTEEVQRMDAANKISASSQKETTNIIARYCELHGSQSIFREIREVLGQKPRFCPPEVTRYATLPWLGKYWLNRYLFLTKSLTTTNPIKKSDKIPGSQLPKYAEVGRIVVLVLRRDAKTKTERLMTPANLKATLASIEKANAVARANGEPVFSHVILFGDIQSREAQGYVTDYENAFAQKQIRILYITKMWKPDGGEIQKESEGLQNEEDENLFHRTQDFWAEFRGETSLPFSTAGAHPNALRTGAPVQVAVLSVFMALQERYKSKLCYVGFKSGFIDMPAFLGSPVFYIDDSVWDDLESAGIRPPTQTLWNGNAKPSHEHRMVAAGNVIDTFIRVDVKADAEGGIALKSPHASLVGALYMYMLADRQDGPCWVRRCGMLKNPKSQEWLRDMYNRAIVGIK